MWISAQDSKIVSAGSSSFIGLLSWVGAEAPSWAKIATRLASAAITGSTRSVNRPSSCAAARWRIVWISEAHIMWKTSTR